MWQLLHMIQYIIEVITLCFSLRVLLTDPTKTPSIQQADTLKFGTLHTSRERESQSLGHVFALL